MKERKQGRYKCLHCNEYFNTHENITTHLWEDLVQKDYRYKEVQK